MKLSFVVPGDKLRLLEDVTFTKGNKYDLIFGQWESLSKGTVLQVSQVYIRKSGWFDSSLTFKIVDGPDVKRASQAKYDYLRGYYERLVKDCNEVLNDLDNNNADFYVEKWSGMGLTTSLEREYHKGDYKKFINTPRARNHRDQIKETIYRHGKIIDKLKLSKVSDVIRIPIKDIEKWEVEVERK